MIDRTHKLSANFTLGEFLHAGVEVEDLPVYIVQNLSRLAKQLQVARDALGKPMKITSGYRTPAHNKAIGGAKNSFHLKGMAADFVVPGMTPRDVQRALEWWPGGMEYAPTWTHLDIRPEKVRFYP